MNSLNISSDELAALNSVLCCDWKDCDPVSAADEFVTTRIGSDVTDSIDSRDNAAQVSHENINELLKSVVASGQLCEVCCEEQGSELLIELFDKVDYAGKLLVLDELTSQIALVATNDWGCKLLQSLIEGSDSNVIGTMCNKLNTLGTAAIRKLAMDKNGNHVLQKIIEGPSSGDELLPIYVALGEGRFSVDLARHRYACRVVQKFLQKKSVDGEPVLKKLVLDSLVNSLKLFELIVDQFGNYSIQCCIEYGETAHRHKIIQEILPFLADKNSKVACNKYASNVLEKLLEFSSDGESEVIIGALLLGDVNKIMKDQFGNYVLQQALKCNPSLSSVKRLRDFVVKCAADLKRSKYGWHLVHRAKLLADDSPSSLVQ